MAGESYAGRFIPVIASEIYDQNLRLVEAGMSPVNLSSIMLGNGLTDFASIFSGYYEMRCTTSATVPPIQDIKSCVRLKQSLSRCEKWLKESCFDRYESLDCKAADNFCEQEILATFPWGVNPYDLTMRCGGEWSDSHCYPITKEIAAYLSRPDIRAQLGVDPAVPANFTNNDEFLAILWANGDRMFPAHYYVAALLERGVRALIYVGVNDLLCNWIGLERMTLAMEWSGHRLFVEQPLKEWTTNGTVAGRARSAGPLTFATVHGAGHMAPYDKPKETLEMVRRWLQQESL